MDKKEFQKKMEERWNKEIYNEVTRTPFTLSRTIKDTGLYFWEYDKENEVYYCCYAGVDKHGRGYVKVYDTKKEWEEAFMADDSSFIESMFEPFCFFFRRTKGWIDDLRFNIACYFERANKGFCRKDLYSISKWFLDIMPKMLRDLKEKPAYISIDENGDKINDYKLQEHMAYQAYHNWTGMLEKIATKFECAKYDEDNPYSFLNEKEKYDEWNKEYYEYKDKMLKEGIELFIKHFRGIGW